MKRYAAVMYCPPSRSQSVSFSPGVSRRLIGSFALRSERDFDHGRDQRCGNAVAGDVGHQHAQPLPVDLTKS